MALDERVHVARAQRFPLHIPLHYRKTEELDWHTCKTVDISRTGILFGIEETLPIGSALDIRVQFPSAVALSCIGSVVRTPEAHCAVYIRNCHILKDAAR